MNEYFTNKLGAKVFAGYLFGMTEIIPSDRVIDKEYRELIKKSLLNDTEKSLTMKELYPYCINEKN